MSSPQHSLSLSMHSLPPISSLCGGSKSYVCCDSRRGDVTEPNDVLRVLPQSARWRHWTERPLGARHQGWSCRRRSPETATTNTREDGMAFIRVFPICIGWPRYSLPVDQWNFVTLCVCVCVCGTTSEENSRIHSTQTEESYMCMYMYMCIQQSRPMKIYVQVEIRGTSLAENKNRGLVPRQKREQRTAAKKKMRLPSSSPQHKTQHNTDIFQRYF